MAGKPEVFVSIDIETDGPAAGLNSMLALGAVSYINGHESSSWYCTFSRLPGARQDPGTMDWWKGQPEAWHEVTDCPIGPGARHPGLRGVVQEPSGASRSPWRGPADVRLQLLVNYYRWYFTGGNPLGFAALDIRSYANGLAGYPSYYGLPEKRLRAMAGTIDTTGLRPHVALDDAIEQGRIRCSWRCAGRSLRVRLAGNGWVTWSLNLWCGPYSQVRWG